MARARSPQPRHVVLRIEYDGTPYSGWSRQPDRRTIEGDLRAAFTALHCRDVRLRCAGRTDAGVHATHQVVDAHYTGSVPIAVIAPALNGQLQRELVVLDAVAAPPGFDARADATSRAYEYRLLPRRVHSPTREGRVLHHPRPLDPEALHAAAALARGQHDFRAFTPSRTEHVFFRRTLHASRWIERDDELVYQVRADAFLRHMVRILVGSMLAVGRGGLALDEFTALLDGAPRGLAANTAPPHGLSLVDVTWEPLPGLPTPPGWRSGRAAGDVVAMSPWQQAGLPTSG